MGPLVLFVASISIIIVTGFILYKLRPFFADERRMDGFYPLSVAVLAWITAEIVKQLSAPEYFAFTYVISVAFITVMPYFSFWFILNFTESKFRKSKALKIFLLSAPALDILLLSTTGLHGLYYRNLDIPIPPSTIPPTNVLFWIHIGLMAVIVIICYLMLSRFIIKNYSRHPLLIITGIGALIPFLLNIVYTFNLFDMSYDLSPIGYFFTIMLFAFFSYSSKIRNFNPVYYSSTLAEITKSPILYAGNIEEASFLVAEEGCKALDVQCISIWKLSDDEKFLNKIMAYEADYKNDIKSCLRESISMEENVEYRDVLFSERVFAISDIRAEDNSDAQPIEDEPSLCAYMDAPIRVGGKLFGVICIEQHRCPSYPERREWTAKEQAFASSLSDLMAFAVENSERHRLEEIVQKTNERMMAVNHAAALLLTTKDNEDVEAKILASMDLVGKANNVDRVHVWKNETIDGTDYHVCIYSWFNEVGKKTKNVFKGYKYAFDEGPQWGDELSKGKSISGPISNRPSMDRRFLKKFDLKSIVVIPLFLDEQFWGFFSIDDCKVEREFSKEEISILRSFSLMLANLINRHAIIAKRTLETEIQTAKKYEYAAKLRDALAKITNSPVLSSGDFDEAEKLITEIVCKAMKVSQVGFWKKTPDGKADINTSAYNYETGRLETNEYYDLTVRPEYSRLVETERIVAMNSLEEIMEILPFVREANTKICASLDAPIRIEGKRVGTFGLEQLRNEAYPNGREWLTEEINFASSIADLMAVAIAGSERRKALEEAEHANQTKSIFLAKVSHEIRTPMNAIIGMAELALREDMSDTIRGHIATVKQAGANLMSIINDILDFSKIESGTMQVVAAEYTMSSLINDVTSIIRMKAFDSRIRFVVNLDSNIPNALIGDEARVRQVLINILGNAVKFTEKGYVALFVTGENVNEETINLTMEVRDSGRGIKEEDLDKLFIDYSQLDGDTSKENEGVGLGLAISRNIIKTMAGDITVESEFGKGSVFTITVPQRIHKPDKLAFIKDPEEKSVLIYERRAVYAFSIAKTLENLNIEFELASSEDEFRQMLDKKDFAFIFASYTLFEANKSLVLGSINSQVVLLTEFGESIPVGNWSTLSLPAHTISIAGILNNEAGNISYNYSSEMSVRFTAPEANVMVVDDINTNLKVAKGLLSPYMMNVDLCDSGFEALDAIKTKRYDIVFMDHRMPGMDGVETTKRIRDMATEDPYFGSVPIIALTANAVAGMKEMFLQSGFNEFMSKPIDVVNLNAVLERLLPKEKQKGSIQENRQKKITTQKIYIDEVDIDKGIMLTGGTLEYYLETLATFYVDGHDRKEEIQRCLEFGNHQLYITHVHALKSASASIGANRISESAYALEMAAIREDMDFVKANNDSFLDKLSKLLDDIGVVLSTHFTGNKKTIEPVDVTELRATLEQMRIALENLEIDEINQTIDKLLTLAQDSEVLPVIRKISQHVLMVEYDEAVSLIEAMLSQENII